MWTKLLPMDSDDQYTALLGIERASRLDEGVYTCQVVDWDVQQCKSLRLEVLIRPEVEVIPKSITVERVHTYFEILRIYVQYTDTHTEHYYYTSHVSKSQSEHRMWNMPHKYKIYITSTIQKNKGFT